MRTIYAVQDDRHMSPFIANFVEQLDVAQAIGEAPGLPAFGICCEGNWGLGPSSSRSRDGWTEREHCQLTKVLCGCRQRKFIVRAGGTTKSESVQLQNALQMGEQHLDLFTIAT